MVAVVISSLTWISYTIFFREWAWRMMLKHDLELGKQSWEVIGVVKETTGQRDQETDYYH